MIQRFSLSLPTGPSVQHFITEKFSLSVLVPSIAAGSVTGIIGVIRAISYASLIFSGGLALHLPAGLGLMVLSTALTMFVVALGSSLPGLIATPLAAPTAMIAIMAGAIAEELEVFSPSSQLATIIMAIALSSILTGAMLLTLGILKQGERIQVIPYPVIGGFMAGTGWLLTRGFIQITTDLPLSLTSLPQFLTPDILWCWLPGIGFAFLLLTATTIWKQFWVTPLMIALCGGCFYGLLWLGGGDSDSARSAGWLLGPFSDGRGQLWQPITPSLLNDIYWPAIAHQWSNILAVMGVSLISLMLSNSSIELVTSQDLNLSREMKAVGTANIVSGLAGGMMGNQALPSTLLVHKLGAKERLTGIIAVLPSLAVLWLGSDFLSFLPKALLGSVILYLGLSLLWKWLYESYHKLPLEDYLTVWTTVVVIDRFGFLQGILAGFVITVLCFMYHYSQVDVANQVFSGAIARSNVEREIHRGRTLSQQGNQIYGLQLQGYLFFGTANYLLSKVRDRLQHSLDVSPDGSGPGALKFLVIDFRQVRGLDASAVRTFERMLKLAQQHNFRLILTNLCPNHAQTLHQGLILDPEWCLIFPDIDRGLEWCEQQILLETAPRTDGLQRQSILQLLAERFLTAEQAQQFMTYLQPQRVPADHYIFRQGEGYSGLYFIESGQVSVLLEGANGQNKRLQTCSNGNLLGEMRFYGKVPLSTSVVADVESQLYFLPKQAFSQMQRDAPNLAQALQSHIVNILCDSLLRREQQLRVMQ